MEAFLVSTGLVAVAEIGDKTQLLAFLLATKFRRPVPIILGILAATVVNHGLAGALGAYVTSLVEPQTLRWILAALFVGMAVWTLIPDKLEDDPRFATFGAFGTTLVAFFLAEIGDKTQIATVALAAKYDALALVVAGTTLGMLIADVPAVILGERVGHRIPLRAVRVVAAGLFVTLGLATGWGVGAKLGF